jgi:hypothetical protein
LCSFIDLVNITGILSSAGEVELSVDKYKILKENRKSYRVKSYSSGAERLVWKYELSHFILPLPKSSGVIGFETWTLDEPYADINTDQKVSSLKRAISEECLKNV